MHAIATMSGPGFFHNCSERGSLRFRPAVRLYVLLPISGKFRNFSDAESWAFWLCVRTKGT